MSDDVCMYVWNVCTHYQIMCKKKDNGDITHYIHIVCLLSFLEHCSFSWTLWEKENMYVCLQGSTGYHDYYPSFSHKKRKEIDNSR